MEDKTVLYQRVSTTDQHLANQQPAIDRLLSYHQLTVDYVYQEQCSAHGRREQFDQMMRDARAGGFRTLVVWSLDRFGRSMHGNMSALLELDGLGIRVLSCKEEWLDTASPVRSLLIAIFSWLGEQESNRISERTKAGMARARGEGKRIGRPFLKIDTEELLALREAGCTLPEIADGIGISYSTLRRYRKRNPNAFTEPYEGKAYENVPRIGQARTSEE